MGTLIYLLCALTSIGCACLLFKSYNRSKNQLLFWSAFCFICLALANILLVLDFIVFPEINLAIARSIITLLGMLTLLYGLIQETTS
ncbi:MAG: DUF5985 family protein [Chlamydiota bacterium]